MHRETFWIMGGGLFGRLACERLQTAWPAARILVVDRREIDAPSGVEGVVSDARVFLDENMHPRSEAWIVPAVPVHLAYEWLADRLRRERDFMPHAIPQDLLPDLPNPCRGPEGQVYLTNADFRCPNDCPEPESTCTVTGRPRPLVMHRYLAALAFEAYTSVVLRSLQLARAWAAIKPRLCWQRSIGCDSETVNSCSARPANATPSCTRSTWPDLRRSAANGAL